jgi:hypothetical protein
LDRRLVENVFLGTAEKTVEETCFLLEVHVMIFCEGCKGNLIGIAIFELIIKNFDVLLLWF